MSYVKYDDNHYLLYLNEKRVEDYHPDNKGESAGDNKTVTAYSYEVTSRTALPRLRLRAPTTTTSSLASFA